MFNMSVEDIIKKIVEEKNIDDSIIREKIRQKINALSNLVSEQGAAYIVANEMGVSLTTEAQKSGFFKVNELKPGLRNISIFLRVQRILGTREFEKNNQKSKVGNFIGIDDTGSCRVVIWDHRVKMLEDGELKPNDVVKITNAYVKDNPFSGVEIHLRNQSLLVLNPPEAPELPEAQLSQNFLKKRISDIKENELVEVLGTIVKVEQRKPFFEVCPECGKRLKNENNQWVCPVHGVKSPAYNLVLSTVIDDGTATIRTVFFGRNAEKILGLNGSEAFIKSEQAGDDVFIIKNKEHELLGSQIIVQARVIKNDFSGNLELRVRSLTTNFDLNQALKDFVENLKENDLNSETNLNNSTNDSLFNNNSTNNSSESSSTTFTVDEEII